MASTNRTARELADPRAANQIGVTSLYASKYNSIHGNGKEISPQVSAHWRSHHVEP